MPCMSALLADISVDAVQDAATALLLEHGRQQAGIQTQCIQVHAYTVKIGQGHLVVEMGAPAPSSMAYLYIRIISGRGLL
jgi:hypothetical protein